MSLLALAQLIKLIAQPVHSLCIVHKAQFDKRISIRVISRPDQAVLRIPRESRPCTLDVL